MGGFIKSVEELEKLYGEPAKGSVEKVARRMTPTYRRWIASSKYCVLSTVGPEGTDGTPRGDTGPVVRELDPGHLAMPDWHGNNRTDSLRNIVADGRLSLMFMVPGSNTIVRVNGRGQVSADADLLQSFEHKKTLPRTVILITISEVYFQCARAPMRSGLWDTPNADLDLPSPGEILEEITGGSEGGADYDQAWPERAISTLW